MRDKTASRSNTPMHDGFIDNLTPIRPLDLTQCQSVSDLVAQMGATAFGARQLGEGAQILYEMTCDPDCFIVLTLSGAMTIAKMGLIVCEMIERGMANAIVSTGALMAHGFVEAAGMTHFKYDPSMSDRELFQAGYDRVYDTLELEKNLDDAEKIVVQVLDETNRNEVLSSYVINQKLGDYLSRHTTGRGILKSAAAHRVPIYVPAFTDSELGLDVALYNRRAGERGEAPFRFDALADLEHYTALACQQNKLGIVTIGGGVPRNWAQQVGPYLDIIQRRIGGDGGCKRFHYGVRICPEPVHWGGLSGCTYSEGVSWGKFVPKEEGGKWAEVFCDATIAWPIMVKAVLERLKKGSSL